MNRITRLLCWLAMIGFATGENLVCYYDSSSYLRKGLGKMSVSHLELAMQFCTHLIYGYAGLNPQSMEVSSLNVDLDMWHYREVTSFKTKFPNLKIFLSVGGDKDIDENHPNKYIELLESPYETQQHFIMSSIELLKVNGFDGLDLAFQFPRNKPRKVHGAIGTFWKSIKKVFTGDFIVDKNAEIHMKQFTEFVDNLKTAFIRNNLSLSLTVLPNVNSTWYFDIPKIAPKFEMINLATFDFVTPQRNPEEADFSAPIFHTENENRLPHYNIDFQVRYWLQECPANKINLGISSYGLAWQLSKDSGLAGTPIVPSTEGPAEPGPLTNSSGLLSWPEVCAKLPNKINANYRGKTAPLRKVVDLEQKHGVYAWKPADEVGNHGLWVSYDDPDFAGVKATYAKRKSLGGVALFDLSGDDANGLCTGQKFPILRSIKYFL